MEKHGEPVNIGIVFNGFPQMFNPAHGIVGIKPHNVIVFLWNLRKVKVPRIRKIGKYFGRAFQLYDDICDCKTDSANSMNFVINFSLSRSLYLFFLYINKYTKLLKEMKLWNETIEEITAMMVDGIKNDIKEKDHSEEYQ